MRDAHTLTYKYIHMHNCIYINTYSLALGEHHGL